MSIFGDILGGLATVYGASQQSKAAKDAANTQAAAAYQAANEQRRQFESTRQDLSPWMAGGRDALYKLDSLLGIGPAASGAYQSAKAEYESAISRYNAAQQEYQGLWKIKSNPSRNARIKQLEAEMRSLNGAIQQAANAVSSAQNAPDPDRGELLRDFTLKDFQTDPGYQFRLSEGNKAIENSAAARGMQLSGANLKGLTRFNQDFASNEYGNAWNRDSAEKQRKFNFLSGQSGQGQQVATNLGQFGAANSGNISDAYLQAGNARAAGQVGSANAWGNAIGNITDYYRMRNLLKAPTSSGSSKGYSGAAAGFGQLSSMGW